MSTRTEQLHDVAEQLKDHETLKLFADARLERRSGNTYVCPVCGSGNGPKHTAAFVIKNGRWKCFSCNNSGDIFDLCGVLYGIEGYPEKVRKVADIMGISVDDAPTAQPAQRKKKGHKAAKALVSPDYEIGRRAEVEKVAAWAKEAEDADLDFYLEARGIGDYPCTFGYDAARKRLIIPWPDVPWYHIDRDITGSHPHKYEKPKSSDVGPQPLFNEKALDEAAFVVVEGALDAYAIMSLGIPAVALCGTGYRQLLDALREKAYQGGVVLMLDNDGPGTTAQAGLARELDALHIPSYAFDYSGFDGKDPDEIIGTAHDVFAQAVEAAWARAAEGARYTDRCPNMTLHDPADVAAAIYMLTNKGHRVPTGFAHLDSMLGGGLTEGLYIFGATSSFGKTTISVQIADRIARSGHPVLFLSIEQSAQEIVAKSLSRLTHDPSRSVNGGCSASDLTSEQARNTWTPDDYDKLIQAVQAYSGQIAPNLRILEARKRPSVDDVRTTAETMRAEFGRPPIVMVDYLQLLAPRDAHMTEKQAVDDNVTALSQLARDLKTAVWCVASLNRESYSGPIDFESFKESGAVEYGADCLLGLQPKGIADEVKDAKNSTDKRLKGNACVDRAKREVPRSVELTVLKNRNGLVTGNTCGIPFSYYPRTNMFIEAGAWEG